MSSHQESASAWLGKRVAEAKGPYIAASLLTIVSAGSFVVFCWYLSQFAVAWVNEGIRLPHMLLYASVFLTGRYLFAHFASQLNYHAANKVVRNIKKAIYPILLRDNRLDSTTGTLYVTRITDDLKPFYAFFIPYAMATAVVSTGLLIVCFWVEKWVGIILLLSVLVIPIQMAVIGIGAEVLHKKHTNLFLKYSAVFYNRLQAIAEIVNLDNFKAQHQFLSKKSEELNKATTSVMRVAFLSSTALELFVTIAIAAVAIYFGMSLLGIMNGPNYGKGYDFGTALFLLTITPYFFFYMRKFVSAYHDRNRALASADLLIPLLRDETEAPSANLDEPLHQFEIKRLDFAYPNSPIKVLHKIDLTLPRKGLVLVKGISGSGKSTLLKICTGSLFPQEGSVSVNGRDNEWSHHWLKAHSSYMNQFPFIFDGTLRYNIYLDKEDKEATWCPDFLHKLIAKKEEGWETPLTHNGKQLSGGEKQLVTLARMMLQQHPIAIMDEPTANLDAETIEIILPQIVKLAQERLVIVASHEKRFDTVADVTLNLNWGEQMNEA